MNKILSMFLFTGGEMTNNAALDCFLVTQQEQTRLNWNYIDIYMLV